MAKQIVKVENKGQEFFLRGTTWAYHRDRADEFDTVELAQAAIDKAKKFMHPTIAKAAKIVEE